MVRQWSNAEEFSGSAGQQPEKSRIALHAQLLLHDPSRARKNASMEFR